MKHIVFFLLLSLSIYGYADSVQQGCVKTRGRMINGKHVPGQGLPGSIVSIKDRTDIGVKNNDGTFSFPVADNQFRVDSVKKKDYVLLDADAASKTYTHTADTLFFVMETPEQILQDKLSTERRLRRSLQTKLQARENELDSLIAIQKISQEEYQQSLQKLYAEQSENDKLISDMAERYSTLDYDQMDEFYRQVSYYIEQCEFVKADSLLKTRGNIHVQLEAAKQQGQAIQQDEEKLQRAKVVHQHDIDELAKRCYSYFENFKMQHQNDSAAYYLKQRVQLDTTNVQWLDEYSLFLTNYLAEYRNAIECCDRALQLSIKRYGVKHDSTATLYNNMGYIYSFVGDNSKTLDYYEKSLQIREELHGLEHIDVAMSYNNVGQTYLSLENYTEALKYIQIAIAIQEKILDQSHVDLMISYNNLGVLYSEIGEFSNAIEIYGKALAIAKDKYGCESPEIATIYNNIGLVYSYLVDYVHSLEFFKKALSIRQQVFPETHHSIATSYSNIGACYNLLKDYSNSLDFLHKALGIQEKLIGLEHPDIASLYGHIGNVYMSNGNYDNALEYHLKALKILENSLSVDNLSGAAVYNNIGSAYLKLGDYDNAIIYLQKAIQILDEHLGPETPYAVSSYNHIGIAYFQMGNYILSLEYYQKAHDISEKVFGPHHQRTLEIRAKLGSVQDVLNNDTQKK